MSPTKAAILRTKIRALKGTLQSASSKEKEGMAGKGLADNFNKILQDVAAAHPDLSDDLPSPISSRGPFSRLGKSDASYLDLEVMAEQVLALLDLVDDDQ